jgi:molecular chaperone GrpE
VMKQFEQSFAQLGVKRIKTVGEVFDPRLHEAVHMEDGDGNVEVVCEELQPGYMIGDEVIRHAMVKVKMEGKNGTSA